jgi:nucleoside-diphosphate-sugar epimerase
MNDLSNDPESEYRAVNVDATLNLARQAANHGVKRFIYMSSVKACGEYSLPGNPITPSTNPHPCDAYGLSKLQAERGLRQIAEETGMELIIVRPPLVYGPGVKANFASLMSMIKRGIPLPVGLINNNRRSFVALPNLVDFLRLCVDHPHAINKIFMVSDGDDISTRELVVRLSDAMNRPVRIINIPLPLLRFFFKLLGRKDMLERLAGSLQVDISDNETFLGWTPPVSVEDGMSMIAREY